MSLADLLSGRSGPAGRLPRGLDELRGPAAGVVMLPRHLSWPGIREFDLADGTTRRSLYSILLTQGRRNDVARFLNPQLLTEDWPLIRTSLDPKLRRWCERRFELDGAGMHDADQLSMGDADQLGMGDADQLGMGDADQLGMGDADQLDRSDAGQLGADGDADQG